MKLFRFISLCAWMISSSITAQAQFSANGFLASEEASPSNSSFPMHETVVQELATADDLKLLQEQIDELKKSEVIAPVPKEEKKTYPDFKVSGVFQLDAAYFDQSPNSRLTLGDIDDGVGFRRARIAATGNISERASYLMEFDFAQAQARFVDVWGQVNDTPFGNMRIGRFRQPFGMTELTSVRELPFLERPSIFAMSPFRQSGIMFSDTAFDQQMNWAISGFRTISDNFGNIYGDNGGYGTAERVTALLLDKGDTKIVHVGVDHSFLQPARDQLLIATQDEIFLGQQPNLGPSGLSVQPIVNVPPFVNSGILNVNHAHLFNVEGAVSIGRALLQSEYRWTTLDLIGGSSPTVHGGYLTGRYMLTGETIPYNRAGGVFGRVKPNCPVDLSRGQLGAWEIAGQLSMINLNPLVGIPGVVGPARQLNSRSLALNWYWWTNAKCQFEYINASLDDTVRKESTTQTFASRVQFDF
ncbi:MAG: porin [Pirellulaceae bacterium]